MTSSPGDETGSERNRHRSSEPRISRWRRRHEEEVADLDPTEVAALMQRAAEADREPVSAAREALQQADVDDAAIQRVISDALEIGLADPSPVDDRRHLLPRRRSDGDRPAAPAPVPGGPTNDRADLEARVLAAEARADEYAAKLRHAPLEQVVADQARIIEETRAELARAQELGGQHAEQLRQLRAQLEQAEQRSRTMAAESAARATEHSERVRALVAEREAAEERARSIAAQAPVAADDQDAVNERATREREALEKALAQAVRLADEARTARARAEAEVAAYAARLERAEAEVAEPDDRMAALAASLAAAEERVRALNQDANERNALHSERIDALLADVEAAESTAQEARRVAQHAEARMFEAQSEAQMTTEQRTAALSEAHQALADAQTLAHREARARAEAEARVAALERQLDEAYVLPVFSPVEAVAEPQVEPPVEMLEPLVESYVEPLPEPEEDPTGAETWFAVDVVPDDLEPDEPEAIAEPEPEPEVEELEVEPVVDVEPEPVVDEEPEPEVDEEPEPEVVEEPEPETEPVPASAGAVRTAPTTYDSKRSAGVLGPAAGVVALGCAAAVGWMAYQATVLDHLALGLVLTVIALIGLAVALRQRSRSSEVHLEKGTLRLRHGDQHHTFYLTSTSTQLEMTGQPGEKDWTVQVLRRGMAPVTIDHKDVDPVAFTEALRNWRSDV